MNQQQERYNSAVGMVVSTSNLVEFIAVGVESMPVVYFVGQWV